MSFKQRCFGNNAKQELYANYHDKEWGIPSFDDRYIFEMLILEGAQAGLSWETILKKREYYRQAFYNFDLKKICVMTDADLDELLQSSPIIKNRLKIYSVRKNAHIALAIKQKYGSLNKFFWSFINFKPIINFYADLAQVPALTPLSETISKELKKMGMTFVGPTIIYSFMQAIGMVDDHIKSCWKRTELLS